MRQYQGQLDKMAVALSEEAMAQYQMVLGEQTVDLNALLGQQIRLLFDGEIRCMACARRTKKSYSGGYCFPCSQKLARCDLCIVKPETCHYGAGTCREPGWADTFCMQDHIVYLANSSGLKVGITRLQQIPTRWIDQGAVQALPVFQVKSRYQSGLIEVVFKKHISDRTDWRKMLKGQHKVLDLCAQRDALIARCQAEIAALAQRFGDAAMMLLHDAQPVTIHYPVLHFPETVKSLNFDKSPQISGTLLGIKGQYLILDSGVLNIRKFAGYVITMVTP